MVYLPKLLYHDSVVIQSHNIPDIDTVASAFALYCYFRDSGVPVMMVYAGPQEITKPNITEFIRLLNIPIQYIGRNIKKIHELVPHAENPLLIMADCQYKTGNTDLILCDTVCVIDHHIQEVEPPEIHVIKPYLGSCSTLVWQLLENAEYKVRKNKVISTALYYGLYTDTNSLSEIYHPIDRDMLEHLQYDKKTIQWLKHNNLTKEELLIAGNALIEIRHLDEISASLFMAAPCDPNILGFINDLCMQVKGVTVCVGFNELSHGIKLSIRSASNEVMANELAAYLTQGMGSGGGNREKAGGFMQQPEDCSVMDYLTEKIKLYYDSYDKIIAGKNRLDTRNMKLYRQMPTHMGYVDLASIFPQGTDVLIRTLTEENSFTINSDCYGVLGFNGDFFPITKTQFLKEYLPAEGEFAFIEKLKNDAFYHPTIKNLMNDEQHDLLEYAKPCLPSSQNEVYAKELTRTIKVFDRWHDGGYMLGQPGDYLAVPKDDWQEVHIIHRNVFELMYEEVDGG